MVSKSSSQSWEENRKLNTRQKPLSIAVLDKYMQLEFHFFWNDAQFVDITTIAVVDLLDIVNYMLADGLIIEVNEPHHSTVNFYAKILNIIYQCKLHSHYFKTPKSPRETLKRNL